MDKITKARLHSDLVKLGDMMGDGLHHEPDGYWIPKEYKRVMKALGLMPKEDRSERISLINKCMVNRVKDVACLKCGGVLKQTRSGAKRAQCVSCSARFQLLK